MKKNIFIQNQESIGIPKEKKNLIHIYLESMETTYGEEGRWRRFPRRSSSLFNFFDQRKSLFLSTRQDWRRSCGDRHRMDFTGGMVASSAGVPLNFPITHPFCTDKKPFMKGLVGLGDILEKNGYSQYFDDWFSSCIWGS